MRVVVKPGAAAPYAARGGPGGGAGGGDGPAVPAAGAGWRLGIDTVHVGEIGYATARDFLLTSGKKTVHVISHTHWDREWYMPFEKFRMRLVTLLDRTLDLLSSPEHDFHFFHLDGHTLSVDDYLQLRPEQAPTLRRLIREGRLFVGPWYVLQDAFLTSGEAQVRNLQFGIERARELGGVTMVGYFPDTFGNMSQAAQILQGFEIDSAVFGRGINAIAHDNQVRHDQHGVDASELWWESPDGSRVFAIFLANWYHNGMELPTEPAQARARGTTMLANVERFATTPHLLLMNGCDHQPVQADVGAAIRVFNEVFPDYAFLHSHFPHYIDCVRATPQPWPTVSGELTGEYTDGWTTLVNTASSRLYLKQWNARVQAELERWVEPFGAIAQHLGEPYPHAFVRHAWRLLLQNHPHDSICGCSVDEVHDEMMTRFRRAWQVAETLSAAALAAIANRIDTVALAPAEHGDLAEDEATHVWPLVVFNPLGWGRDDLVEAQLDTETELPLDRYTLYDAADHTVPFTWDDLGWVHGFTLLEDRFRIPWRRRRYRLRFWAEGVPALGHTTFVLRPQECPATVSTEQASCWVTAERGRLENKHLRIDVHLDGSLDVTHKATGKVYRNLLVFEDTGDIGNEYMYIAAENAQPITTEGHPAALEPVSSGLVAQLRIRHEIALPMARDGTTRAKELQPLRLSIMLSLGANARRLEVTVSFDNRIKDHRLRVLFPSELETEYVYADAPFDVVKRNVHPWSGWTNPSRCERMQSFFDLSDGQHGLMIATVGLPEYEVLRDGRNTMALTLLRCVGEMGDWNYFPTPGAQCQGLCEAHFAIIPHTGTYAAAMAEAAAFTLPLRAVATTVHHGAIEPNVSWAAVDASAVVVTALKPAETFDGLLLRFVNLAPEEQTVNVTGALLRKTQVAPALLNERMVEPAQTVQKSVQLPLPGKRIMTLGLQPHRR